MLELLLSTPGGRAAGAAKDNDGATAENDARRKGFRDTADLIHRALRQQQLLLQRETTATTPSGVSLYYSTFSRTVWRLYGGAEGLVTLYCRSPYDDADAGADNDNDDGNNDFAVRRWRGGQGSPGRVCH